MPSEIFLLNQKTKTKVDMGDQIIINTQGSKIPNLKFQKTMNKIAELWNLFFGIWNFTFSCSVLFCKKNQPQLQLITLQQK